MLCNGLRKDRARGFRNPLLVSLIGAAATLGGSAFAQDTTPGENTVNLDLDSSAKGGSDVNGLPDVRGKTSVNSGTAELGDGATVDIAKATGVIIRVPVDKDGNEMTSFSELRVYEGETEPDKSKLDKIFFLSGVVPDITANERGRLGNGGVTADGISTPDSGSLDATTIAAVTDAPADNSGDTIDLDADSSTGFGYGRRRFVGNYIGWNSYRGGWNRPFYYRDNFRPVYRGYSGNVGFGGSSYYNTYRSSYRTTNWNYGGYNSYYGRGGTPFNGYQSSGYAGRRFPYNRYYYYNRW